MADRDDDVFEGEADGEDEFNRLSDLLLLRINEFADEHGVPDAMLASMLMALAVMTRMMGYAASVDKPSSFGLKLDLDRFRRDVDELLRAMKKDAETFLDHARKILDDAEREGGTEQ